MMQFLKKATIKAPIEKVFNWHKNPGALNRLTPPWIRYKILQQEPFTQNNATVKLKLFWGFLKSTWTLKHNDYKENEQFVDKQVKGPFRSWSHKHRFKSDKNGNTIMEDHINYTLPLAPLSHWILSHFCQNKIKRLIQYRHEVLKKDLQPHHIEVKEPLKILIVGASGFIGQPLKHFLSAQGHHVIELSHTERKDAHHWDPLNNKFNYKILENLDAVINLAGAPILNFWTQEQKEKLYQSRVHSTQLLTRHFGKLKKPPRVLINASGINIYGAKRTERLHEESPLGNFGFLTSLCKDWESATSTASEAGTRVVLLRTGMVLSPSGGALKRMLPAFQCCLGGRLGSGLQSISWIAMDDLLDIIYFCILNPKIQGSVNATAPNRVTNFRFKQALAAKLSRPAWFPIPTYALKLFFGQMAEETILSDLKVQPQKLLAAGYKFRYPRIEQALKHLLP